MIIRRTTPPIYEPPIPKLEEQILQLDDLLGPAILTGVSFGHIQAKEYQDSDPQTIDFILNGRIISAVEDPSDGYRSAMDTLLINREGANVTNIFPAVAVTGRRQENSEYNTNDVIEFVDNINGKVVLRVGTDNIDDYYPCFVAQWFPDDLSVNSPR